MPVKSIHWHLCSWKFWHERDIGVQAQSDATRVPATLLIRGHHFAFPLKGPLLDSPLWSRQKWVLSKGLCLRDIKVLQNSKRLGYSVESYPHTLFLRQQSALILIAQLSWNSVGVLCKTSPEFLKDSHSEGELWFLLNLTSLKGYVSSGENACFPTMY